MDSLIVITNLPDRERALQLGAQLVEQKLAACVNVLAPCTSIYRWQGAIQNDSEHPLLIKTTRDRIDALIATIRARHPYELPEIVALRVEAGLPEYLRWVEAETRPGAAA